MRVDADVDGSRSTWIYDAAAGSITRLDPLRKNAHVEAAAPASADLRRETGGDHPVAELTATGRSRELLGRSCQEYSYLFQLPFAAGSQGTARVAGQVWVSKDAPGLADYLAFHQTAAAQRLVFGDRGGVEPGDPGLAIALARGQTELRRLVAELGGMPYAVRLRMTREGGKLLAVVDRRLHGTQLATAVSVTTEAIPGEALTVPADWTIVTDGTEGLVSYLRDGGNHGRIHLLGRRFWLGLGASVSALGSAAARDAFGSARWQPVVRLVSPLNARGLRLSLAPVFKRYGSADVRARVIGATAGLSFNLAPARTDVVPFGALRAGPCFVSTPGASTRVRPGANLELGLSFRRHFVLSGSYELFGRSGGLSLSSWSINAVVRVL
jgi:hypothetical protein